MSEIDHELTTPLDLDALQALADAATEAPWTAHPDGLVWSELLGDPVSGSVLPEDAEFIAAARAAVPALIAEVTRLRSAVYHMLALAPDEYGTYIAAARASMSEGDYALNNGRAEMIRVFATGLAERAGLPVADWEQIKQSVPADGVYRGGEPR